MPRVKKPKLTAKQAKFVQGIAEGKPAYKAALEAYDTDKLNVANTIAGENMQKPAIKQALEPILAKHQIDLDNAIAPIGRGLKAKKIVQIEGDFFQTDVDDLDMQLKASDRALKLMGIGQDKSPQGNNFIQVNNNYGDRYSE